MIHVARILLAAVVIAASGSAGAVDGADDRLFRERVAPLLERRCLGCHNDEERKGGLSLQSRGSALTGGESGSAIAPEDPDGSYLLDLVTPHAGRAEMPKGGTPLSGDDVELLREWIAAGTEWPAGLRLNPNRVADADWWPLRPLRRPPIPVVSEPEGLRVRNPIDAFVSAKLREQGLAPAGEANRCTLIRRLSFDLVGLPPSPEEVDAFLADPDPLAYENLVDRLLASPQYGERWARHWLDVAHYGDSHGYDKDQPRPNAWPYRDYVIRSLNADKPYERFVGEQVAGDVLFPDDPDGVVATGFLAAGAWNLISHVEVPASKPQTTRSSARRFRSSRITRRRTRRILASYRSGSRPLDSRAGMSASRRRSWRRVRTISFSPSPSFGC